jgi:diguanylate cyclase (GGDEF)-like protein
MDTTSGWRGAGPELTPVAVTRWTARLVDPNAERSFREGRFQDDRRRVLVLMGFIAAAGVLIVIGRFIGHLGGNGELIWLLPPVVPVVVAAIATAVLLRMKSPRTLETCLLAAGVVAVATRLTSLTLQPAMADNWLPLMITSLFIIYFYLPLRLAMAVAFAAFYSAVSAVWWVALYSGPLAPEQIYFGLLWIALGNGLGYAAANALQRGQRIQYAQSLVLRQLLSTDSMTGIANRRRFDMALEREWRRCRRAGTPMSLLMIDVDHFKAYNDYCGHPQGDACLRQLAQLLVETVGRPGDIVARYGGEEFVVLLPEVGAAGALAVANKLAAALRHADIFHPRSPAGPRMTISIGAATAKDLTGDPAGLVEFADRLLYAAKAAGRNQISVGQLTPAAGARAA